VYKKTWVKEYHPIISYCHSTREEISSLYLCSEIYLPFPWRSYFHLFHLSYLLFFYVVSFPSAEVSHFLIKQSLSYLIHYIGKLSENHSSTFNYHLHADDYQIYKSSSDSFKSSTLISFFNPRQKQFNISKWIHYFHIPYTSPNLFLLLYCLLSQTETQRLFDSFSFFPLIQQVIKSCHYISI
jgi:hypothetical protein